MRVIYNRIFLLFGIFLFTACSDNDNSVLTTDNISIVEANVSFAAEGGKGSIVVAATGRIDVSVDPSQSWCKWTRADDIITVTVLANKELEGRTVLVKISTKGGNTLSVPVTQKGAVLSVSAFNIDFEGEGGRKAIAVKNTLLDPYEVEVENDWLTYKIDGDSLVFTAGKSNVVKRESTARIILNERVIEVLAQQINIEGNYKMSYYEYEDTIRYTRIITLTAGEKVGTYIMTGDLPEGVNSILFNYKNRRLTVYGAQNVGVHTYENPLWGWVSRQLMLGVMNFTQYSAITYDVGKSYAAPLTLTKENKIIFEFGDDRTWLGPSDRIIPVEAIVVGEFDSGYYYGRLYTFMLMVLELEM
ncbi:hypothetical protein EZS27_010620 [termite gut metagenome]|uniref:BACON domain-containing protein n=1 Tax=termite gut metagenome TaxID=433724 RepID=A0A5J4S663_9ZZZZ